MTERESSGNFFSAQIAGEFVAGFAAKREEQLRLATEMFEPAGDVDAFAAGPTTFGTDVVLFLPEHVVHTPLGVNGRIEREDERGGHGACCTR